MEWMAVLWLAVAPGSTLEWFTTEGYCPVLKEVCHGHTVTLLAVSTSRAAWDCSLKCEVYPSQGGISTRDRQCTSRVIEGCKGLCKEG